MGLLFSFFTVVALVLMVLIGVKAAHSSLPVWRHHTLYGFSCIYRRNRVSGCSVGAYPLYRSGILTTAGQEKSLPWIKQNKIDNPSTSLGVIIRMALEVLLFRSLFRNTRTELRDGPKISYGSTKWLWAAGLAFHWTFLIILTRHFRLFLDPVPMPIMLMEALDGLFQVGAPVLYITDLIFLGAVTFLFLKRVIIPQVRYISLAADFFPLFLIGAIGTSGVLMRYFLKTDCCRY